MDENKKDKEKKEVKRIIIKGYLRPDGTYYVSIPKEVKEIMELKGGEYFVVKGKPEKKKISLKLVEFFDELEEKQ